MNRLLNSGGYRSDATNRSSYAPAAMNDAPFTILYEDNHLLVVDKPAGLVTMGALPNRPTLLNQAKGYIKTRYHKPGNVYLGIVSRLDAPVTGVIVLARTSKAAARLTKQFRLGQVEKVYWALVEGKLANNGETLTDWLGEDERHRRMRIVGSTAPGAKEARLSYRRLSTIGADTLIEIRLATGRKHQIRVQMSNHGHAIYGDRKYGNRLPFGKGIALHARRLAFSHPTTGNLIDLTAPLPRAWRDFGVRED